MVKEIYNDEVEEDLQDNVPEEDNIVNDDIDKEDEEWDNEF